MAAGCAKLTGAVKVGAEMGSTGRSSQQPARERVSHEQLARERGRAAICDGAGLGHGRHCQEWQPASAGRCHDVVPAAQPALKASLERWYPNIIGRPAPREWWSFYFILFYFYFISFPLLNFSTKPKK